MSHADPHRLFGGPAAAEPRPAVATREPYLNAQQAAAYLGYDIEGDRTRALKAFYGWVRKHRVPKYGTRGRLLLRRVDLDRAVGFDCLDSDGYAGPRQMLRAGLPEPRRRA